MIAVKVRPRRLRRIIASSVAAGALGLAGVGWATEAKADYEPGCQSQFWMYQLRASTRTICDGPIFADGSWKRLRVFYAPRRYVPVTCNYTRYSGYCNGGYWLDELDVRDIYPVTPDTVLPDEPGHIPQGTTT